MPTEPFPHILPDWILSLFQQIFFECILWASLCQAPVMQVENSNVFPALLVLITL